MGEKMTIMIPQWQGGGQDLCTYYGAFAFNENYFSSFLKHNPSFSKAFFSIRLAAAQRSRRDPHCRAPKFAHLCIYG